MKKTLVKTNLGLLIEALDSEINKTGIHNYKAKNELITIMLADILNQSKRRRINTSAK